MYERLGGRVLDPEEAVQESEYSVLNQFFVLLR
jgi:hypothetical protein